VIQCMPAPQLSRVGLCAPPRPDEYVRPSSGRAEGRPRYGVLYGTNRVRGAADCEGVRFKQAERALERRSCGAGTNDMTTRNGRSGGGRRGRGGEYRARTSARPTRKPCGRPNAEATRRSDHQGRPRIENGI